MAGLDHDESHCAACLELNTTERLERALAWMELRQSLHASAPIDVRA